MMSDHGSALGRWTRSLRDQLLEFDNFIIGLLIFALAARDWLTLYNGIERLQLYFSQGIYGLSSLSVLSTVFSALYLTFAAIILLTLRRPLSRYTAAFPNLIAVCAAFAVYLFILTPGGDVMRTNVYVSLSLILAGSIIVVTALLFLRRAFSVTPQARYLVTSGPYALVRHPMYVGNILSLLGLALLIDSREAFLLFVICAALQIGRALYEERLLEASFPEYADYKRRVGRFFPRIRFRKRAAAAVLLLSASSLTAGSAAATALQNRTSGAPATTAIQTEKHLSIRLAQAGGNWGAKCEDWRKKAVAGTWFTESDQKEFSRSESENIESLAACRPFFQLQTKCQDFAGGWMAEEIKDAPFLDRVESLPGCKAIIGFEHLCQALLNLAKRRVALSQSRRSMMTECLVEDLRSRRVDLLRPMM